MLFKPRFGQSLFQGKLTTDHPASSHGRPVIVSLDGTPYGTADVDFVVPDDEPQGETVQAAGYKTHTPLSMVVGPGSTES